uniref:Uncharacterized protein n=1 Tax=Anguilla anguilla TaxID=7936 RepID=A0A0E9R908_ANGAN
MCIIQESTVLSNVMSAVSSDAMQRQGVEQGVVFLRSKPLDRRNSTPATLRRCCSWRLRRERRSSSRPWPSSTSSSKLNELLLNDCIYHSFS